MRTIRALVVLLLASVVGAIGADQDAARLVCRTIERCGVTCEECTELGQETRGAAPAMAAYTARLFRVGAGVSEWVAVWDATEGRLTGLYGGAALAGRLPETPLDDAGLAKERAEEWLELLGVEDGRFVPYRVEEGMRNGQACWSVQFWRRISPGVLAREFQSVDVLKANGALWYYHASPRYVGGPLQTEPAVDDERAREVALDKVLNEPTARFRAASEATVRDCQLVLTFKFRNGDAEPWVAWLIRVGGVAEPLPALAASALPVPPAKCLWDVLVDAQTGQAALFSTKRACEVWTEAGLQRW